MKILLIVVALLLAGCTTQAERQAAANGHYSAQTKFVAATVEANQPLFELEAKDGEEIRMGGVKRLVVRANQPAPTFQAAPVQRSDAVEVLTLGLGVIERTFTGVAPYAAGVEVLRALAGKGNDNSVHTTTTSSTSTSSTVGNNSGTNSGNSGTLKTAVGNLNDATSTPTVVTQPAPLVLTQPAPLVVTQPAPVVVTQPPVTVVCNPGPC